MTDGDCYLCGNSYIKRGISRHLRSCLSEPNNGTTTYHLRITGAQSPDYWLHLLVEAETLLSDVQRNANDLRQDVADVLLYRLHHDRPVSGPFGSVQRMTRRNRSLKDDEEVLETLENAGIDGERVLGVDRDKVDDALDVTELSKSDVYDIDESEYVRKAEVDEERKETRLQGLKDQLAATEGEEAEELRKEIEELEDRLEELTEFKSGASFHTPAGGEP